MVTKRKGISEREETKGKVKVGKLNLNKETLKDLADADAKKVRGGLKRQASANSCAPTCDGSYTCPA
jgi:hypothetical protein